MWWRHAFIGDPEEVVAMSKKLVEYDASEDVDDMMWSMMLDDVRAAIGHYDAKYGDSVLSRLTQLTLPRCPTLDWPYALRCHGGDGKGFEPR